MEEKEKKGRSGKEKDKTPETSRRDFMKKFGIYGAATFAGSAAIYSGYKFEKEKGKDEYVKVLTEDNKLVKIPKDQIEELQGITEKSMQKRGRVGVEGKRWTMVLDLSKCRNARKCVTSCQNAHDLRPHEYHINTLAMQDTKDTAPYFMPKQCQHCDNPPCVSVCPVDATFKRQDGIVLIDNERCIGCRFCMAACPYSARIFHWKEPQNEIADKDDKYDIERNVPQKKGTISKCVFSADLIREGQLPSCVSACPNGVFYFGDQNEDAVTNGTTKETVRLSQLLKDNGGYKLLPELGTEPRIFYLPPKNRLFDFPEDEKPDNNHGDDSHA